ncbi:MAG: FAD-dependent oxidoreductase [Pseudomonadota bacterium]
MIKHDAIVIGGGLAGLRAAIELNRHNIKVAVISKVHPIRSHSVAAQGGINASLGNHPRGLYDSCEKHAFDTVKGSDYLADQDAVLRMTKEAPIIVREMENFGCPFSRTEDGLIAQRPFGGAGFPRTAYAKDKTGLMLLHTLYEQVVRYEHASERQDMVVYDEWIVLKLVVSDGKTDGVIAMNVKTGEIECIQSSIVIFATGGSGRIYGKSSNALQNNGHGMALAYWEGIPLKDMEFIQFHPTCLLGSCILMTEGCRGEGGYLKNNLGERFLANYSDSSKAMEVAPRDIVARNIQTEINEGRGFAGGYVNLELMHLGEKRIMERLPGIRDISMNFVGVDPITDPIPIHPAQHYTMGGISANIDCETEIKGTYAAGECSCVSVHGANRLGGNSLLETIVFGKIAGKAASEYATSIPKASDDKALANGKEEVEVMIKNYFDREGKEKAYEIKNELNSIMDSKVGIFRNKEGLSEAVEGIQKLRERFKNVAVSFKANKLNQELLSVIDLKSNLDVALAIVTGSLKREESRGSQFRTDFQTRDDAKFLKHTCAYYTEDGPKLKYTDVNLSLFEPKERKY